MIVWQQILCGIGKESIECQNFVFLWCERLIIICCKSGNSCLKILPKINFIERILTVDK